MNYWILICIIEVIIGGYVIKNMYSDAKQKESVINRLAYNVNKNEIELMDKQHYIKELRKSVTNTYY